MFIISSFLAFSSNISSRVISRVSIAERSSLGSFFPKTKAGDPREVEIADWGMKASAGRARAAKTATRAVKRTVREIMLVVLKLRVGSCRMQSLQMRCYSLSLQISQLCNSHLVDTANDCGMACWYPISQRVTDVA